MNRTLSAGLFALSLITAGCAVDPIGECQTACEEQRSRMCNGFMGDENCVTRCANADTDYDATRADADRIGCGSEFNGAYGCFTGGDSCDNTRCNSEVNSLVACGQAYCTVNPTDRVCTGP